MNALDGSPSGGPAADALVGQRDEHNQRQQEARARYLSGETLHLKRDFWRASADIFLHRPSCATERKNGLPNIRVTVAYSLWRIYCRNILANRMALIAIYPTFPLFQNDGI